MKKIINTYFLILLGLIVLGAGLYLIKAYVNPQGVMIALPYVLVGLGCGIFGHGMGNTVSNRLYRAHPDIERQMVIEKNDERNIAIGNRAKAMAYDMMVFVFGALMLSFALMEVDMTAILLLVFAYLFVIGYGIFYRIKYDKEM